ncbi:MAG: Gfo/Idh/MocA family oxidoreductase [Lentisphaerae bacterium]|nr:Gfo/Idh/MocA family oxidoreductase [Lentisphaerota bacterium]
MRLSVFTDELGLDVTQAVSVLRQWGIDTVDLRGLLYNRAVEALSDAQLGDLRRLLDDHGLRVGCIESSLAKVHLPDSARRAAEAAKLEGVIRAADALDCRLVRSFFFWQPPRDQVGILAVRPDEQQRVLDAFLPLAERARAAGLVLAFENCGVSHDDVLAMLRLLAVPEWGLAWDVANTWNCPEREADVTAFCRRLAAAARVVHVKARGCVPGQGMDLIPYDEVLQICDQAGLRGPVSVETHNPDPQASPADMSRKVVDALRAAWPSAAPGTAPRPKAPAVRRPWHDEPVGFAVVGLGMGHNRAKDIHTTSGTRLVGVCDLVEERARRTGEALDVPWTTDARRWLDDPAVEVVVVMTETGRHGEVAQAALEAGKHVITTKPMEASLAACDAMIRTAEERGLLLAVDFGRRFQDDLVSLKATLAAGAIGKLLSGSFELKILRDMDYFRGQGGWRGTRRWDGGGVLSNQSIHHIDEFAFAVGLPRRVRCCLRTQTHPIEAEDYGTAVWEYADGLMITFTSTTSYPQQTWFDRLELVGTAGAHFRVEGGPFEKPMERWFLQGAWTDQAPVRAQPEWRNAADNMAAALRSGAALTCTGRDGRRTQSILDAMYRSACDADGAWVDLAPELPQA